MPECTAFSPEDNEWEVTVHGMSTATHIFGGSGWDGRFVIVDLTLANTAGKVYLILGASLGTTAEIDLSLADYSFVGEESDDRAGLSVSSAGDVDGDGLDDILVGAYVNDDGGGAAGKTYLILGASLGTTSEIDLSDADYSFVGENSGDRAGLSVSSAGDVDGDGLDDILVGAYGAADYAGKAYLIISGL